MTFCRALLALAAAPFAVLIACGPDASSGGPRLAFEEPEVELGAVLDQGHATHRFSFTNTGDRELRIEDIKASCRCTAVTGKGKKFRPGESDALEVNLNLNGISGKRKAVVYVESNDPVQPKQTLSFSVEVFPAVEAQPPILRLGDVAQGAGKTAALELTVRGQENAIGDVDADNPFVAVRVLSAEERQSGLGPERHAVLEVSLKPDAPPGALKGSVIIKNALTGPSGKKIPIWAEIVGDIHPSIEHLFIAEKEPGQPFESQIDLESRSGAAFSITRIESQFADELGLKFQAAEDAANPSTARIGVSGVTPARTGAIRGEILIHTDKAEEPIRIPLHGYVSVPQSP